MSRFFVSPEQISGGKIHITGQDVKHISKVLRLKTGDKITVSNGQNQEYLAVITDYLDKEVICDILSITEVNREAPVNVTIFQGLPKGDKLELIIQKCTEIGVTEIIPVVTERTIVHLDAKKAKERRERWQRVAEEAAKQAGRTRVPQVGELLSLKSALGQITSDVLAIMPWENEKNTGLKQILQSYKNNEIYMFIGPEGGFAPEEVDLAKAAGVTTVTLGPRILRTETAGMAAATMVLYQLGDMGGL